MAEIKAQGRVIETRAGLIVIRRGTSTVEETFEVKADGVVPGDYVRIFDDGQVEVGSPNRPLPDNVTEHSLPAAGTPDPDHS